MQAKQVMILFNNLVFSDLILGFCYGVYLCREFLFYKKYLSNSDKGFIITSLITIYLPFSIFLPRSFFSSILSLIMYESGGDSATKRILGKYYIIQSSFFNNARGKHASMHATPGVKNIKSIFFFL